MWNVWELAIWELNEIIFPKILKPCPGLVKMSKLIN